MDNYSVKKNLMKSRREKHLTQKQMADSLGISRTAYRNLEQGDTKLISDRLSESARILGKSDEELIMGYKPVPESGDTLMQISEGLQKIRDLSRRLSDLEKELQMKNLLINAMQTTISSQKETIRILDVNRQ
ncbi:MAG: helix-turn-helix transcriptional regulator [Bacteroidales bacterium]|nr:helix-turn-helix transcriptional regulator [Bacteroidales bacterium]